MLRDHAPARGGRQASPPRLTTTVGSSFADVAHVPPGHAAHEPRGWRGAPVAAWPPATGAVPAGSQVLGSSVGSTAVPGNADRSPCAGIPSAPDAGRWRRHPSLAYPRYVPREVTTPLGQPGEDPFNPPRALPPPRCLILRIRPLRKPAASLFAVTDDVTHLVNPTPKETEEEGLPNLRAVSTDVKEGRRKQGRRRFRCDLARKEITKETVAIDPSEQADEEGYERRTPSPHPSHCAPPSRRHRARFSPWPHLSPGLHHLLPANRGC